MNILDVLLVLLNFFFLDRDPRRCARYHGDKHLNKMQLEYAQIASTAYRFVCGGAAVDETVYRATHRNHPVVLWACQSRAHVMAVINVGLALAEEKKERALTRNTLHPGKPWKTTHASTPVLEFIRDHMPDASQFQDGDRWTDPPACMPEKFRRMSDDIVECYRLYYAGDKVSVTGLAWEPYAREPWFIQGCKRKLHEEEEQSSKRICI